MAGQGSGGDGVSGDEAGRIRLVLADDHALVRQGLRSLLDLTPDLRVVGEAGDGEEALRKVAELDRFTDQAPPLPVVTIATCLKPESVNARA